MLATTAAKAKPFTVTRDEATARLESVEPWIRALAGRYSKAARMSAFELAEEIRVAVFLRLPAYNPRWSFTTFTGFVAKNVVQLIRVKRATLKNSAVPFSVLAGSRAGDRRGRDVYGDLAVEVDEDAGGSRLDREEVDAELVDAVRGAVAGLTETRRRRVRRYYGLDGGDRVKLEDLAAADGTTTQAIAMSLKDARRDLAEDARLRRVARERGLACDACGGPVG